MNNRIPMMKKANTITKVSSEYVLFPNAIEDKTANAGILNESAAEIISRINGEKTIEQIAEELLSIYKLKKQDAIDAVYKFVSQLVEGGICIWKE